MASLSLFKVGPRSVRVECERVNEQDTKAVYNTTGLAYVETYDDVEYVTSAGIYFRQDDAPLCKEARDTHDREARVLKEAVEAAAKQNADAKAAS